MKFVPYIIYDKQECFFPASIDYYLANSRAIDKNHFMYHVGEIISDNIGNYKYHKRMNIKAVQQSCLYGFNTNEDLSVVPLYGNVIEYPVVWILQYIIFYPWKGGDYFCGLFPLSSSIEGFFQFIHLVINKHNESLEAVYVDGQLLDSHYWILEDNNHIVLYSELHTHDLYPHLCNGWFFIKGYVFKPKFIEYIDQHTSWITFMGTIGDQVLMPMYNPLWLE
jgi:hypothetical protein